MSLQPPTAIQITNLTKVYKLYAAPEDRLKEALHPSRKNYHKEFYALDNINLEIKVGESLGIIGKNGAGKSTLLKILTGVLTQTSGSIKINGIVSALLELGAGFNPELSGYDNLYFNGMIMGYSKEEMRGKEEDILAFADIGDYVYQPVKTYSSGMFARLAFAVAVNVDPDILIVDEVLSVGDMRFQQKSIRRMNEFREKGKTILFVTHDVEEAIYLADQIFILSSRPGTIVEFLEKADAFRRPERFRDVLIACEADGRGRAGFESTPYPQRQWLIEAFTAAAIRPTAADLADHPGAAIAEHLRRRRIAAIAALRR